MSDRLTYISDDKMAEPMTITREGTADAPDGCPEGLYEVDGLMTARDMLALGTLLMTREGRTDAQEHATACMGGRLEAACEP